ncbi:MAG: hypothetical protein E7321_06370 [Clostridiales bacterium]|nr:hypothetical protein [Clostridiales bacterium]
MIEQDTIKLLRECDAGIQMGVSAIDQVLDHAQSESLRRSLTDSKAEHDRLKEELQTALERFGDEGKNPNPMAKTMSTVKTNMEMMMKPTDATIADLITDGCNMGVKSLSKYLNQYAAADESAKDVCKKLIAMEEQLAKDLRGYL